MAVIKCINKEKWNECTFTFTAHSKYLVIESLADADLYFDDFEVIPTGKEGDNKSLETVDSKEKTDIKGSNALISVIIILGATVLGVLVTVFVILRKKKQ